MKLNRLLPYLLVLGITACATPAPKPADFYYQVQPENPGLAVDLDLLETARLGAEEKRAGSELLQFFHSAETSLETYTFALEGNLETNEHLDEQYDFTAAMVGIVAGLSSPAILATSAAIAIPIAGAIWIGSGIAVQQLDIKPQLTEAKQRLGEAQRLYQLFPDVTTAFRGLVFTPTESESRRRFKQWQAYVENIRKKCIRFFGPVVEASPLPAKEALP